MDLIANTAGRIGRNTIGRIERFMYMCAFASRIFSLLIRRPVEGRALIRLVIADQVYFTAVQGLLTLVFVCSISLICR